MSDPIPIGAELYRLTVRNKVTRAKLAGQH
jgi:hypothetical protein